MGAPRFIFPPYIFIINACLSQYSEYWRSIQVISDEAHKGGIWLDTK
jgi:hypothetical protein